MGWRCWHRLARAVNKTSYTYAPGCHKLPGGFLRGVFKPCHLLQQRLTSETLDCNTSTKAIWPGRATGWATAQEAP